MLINLYIGIKIDKSNIQDNSEKTRLTLCSDYIH